MRRPVSERDAVYAPIGFTTAISHLINHSGADLCMTMKVSYVEMESRSANVSDQCVAHQSASSAPLPIHAFARLLRLFL
jgi:hypothetical protein